MSEDLIRPIFGIENRTAQEVFDIMCDRIKSAARRPHTGGGEPVAWMVDWNGGREIIYPGPDAEKIAHGKARTLCGLEWVRDVTVTPLYAGPPTAWKPDREAVARIIDPEIFEQAKNFPKVIGLSRWNRAFAKADQILALQQQEGA